MELELDFTIPICRICLQNQSDENERMFPIFEEMDVMPISISEKISVCTGIKIQQHEKLPSLICRNCMTFLNIAYKFRAICHNSQNFLKDYVFEYPVPLPNDLQDGQPQMEDGQMETQQLLSEQTATNSQKRMQEHISEEIEGSNSNACPTKGQLVKEISHSSISPATHEELHQDYYDECWLEGEETPNKTTNPNPSLSVDQQEDSIVEQVKGAKGVNTTSKVLGMSSDGAAVVIEEKSLSQNSLKSSKMQKGAKQSHVCDLCGNVYDRRYALQAHIRRHRDEKPFECELCGQAFHCNFELSRHIRKHTGIRPYVCSYCKRAFGDRSTMLKHERIHRNERPYSCKTCGKSFTYSSVLKVHQLTHTGEKPFSCELCGRRFSRSHHLRAHLETLLHSNDPRSKTLIKQIKRAEENMNMGTEMLSST